jgi:sigma-E factor negative regulatory protein RseB
VIRAFIVVAAGVGLLVGSVPASACVVGPGAGEDSAAATLLMRAMRAANQTTYSGVQWLTASGRDGTTTTVLLDVRHVPGHGSTVAPAAPRTGDGRAVFDPAPAPHQVAAGPVVGAEPASEVGLLEAHYQLGSAGTGQAAGRSARLVVARRDGADAGAARRGAVAGRWWLDRDTDLILRSEVFDASGRLLRASGYVTVTIGAVDPDAPPGRSIRRPEHGIPPPAGRPAHGPPAPRAVPPAWEPVGPPSLRRLRDEGFRMPQRLDRRFVRFDARAQRTGDERVLHLSYSDGLSTVSVFEQPGRLDPGRLAGFRPAHVAGADVWRRDKIPRRVVWSADGTVYTIVTDGSPAVVRAAVRRLPHDSNGNGTLDRIQHGFGRMGSWFNPFG